MESKIQPFKKPIQKKMIRSIKILFTFGTDDFSFVADLYIFTISIMIITIYSFYLYFRLKKQLFDSIEYQGKIKNLSYIFGKVFVFFGVIARSNDLYTTFQGNPFEETQAIVGIYYLLFTICRLILLYYSILMFGFLIRKSFVRVNSFMEKIS